MRRVTLGNVSVIPLHVVGTDEETPADADGDVVCTVRDHTATLIYTGVAARSSEGVYTFTLPAQTALSLLTLTASYSVGGHAHMQEVPIRVVSCRHFTLGALRASQGLDQALYDAQTLASARDAAEELVDDFTRVGWGRRMDFYGTLAGPNGVYIPGRNPEPVSVVIDAYDVTAHTTVDPFGRLQVRGADPSKGSRTSLWYIRGATEVPNDLSRASRMLARHLVRVEDSAIPDRARTMSTDWATFQLDVASENNPTGLPEVDSVLRRYRTMQNMVFG